MKKVRRSLATILLLSALAASAFADGQMDIPPAPIPRPAHTGTPSAPTTDGWQVNVPPALNANETSTIDTLSEFALDIWRFMPSLF